MTLVLLSQQKKKKKKDNWLIYLLIDMNRKANVKVSYMGS